MKSNVRRTGMWKKIGSWTCGCWEIGQFVMTHPRPLQLLSQSANHIFFCRKWLNYVAPYYLCWLLLKNRQQFPPFKDFSLFQGFMLFCLFWQLQKNGQWRSTNAIGRLLLCKGLTSMVTDSFLQDSSHSLSSIASDFEFAHLFLANIWHLRQEAV